MNYFKAVFDLSRPLEVKISEELDILAKMSNDARFADPPVLYADFSTALDEQVAAMAEAQFGGIERTATKNAKEQVVDDMIRRYKTYVDLVADGDTEIILASGFRHTKPRESAGNMPQVTGTKGGSTGTSGQIQVRWNSVENRSFYRVEVRPVQDPADTPDEPSTGQAHVADWKNYGSKTASIVIDGLQPLTYYEVRVRAIGAAGPGSFSDIILLLVT